MVSRNKDALSELGSELRARLSNGPAAPSRRMAELLRRLAEIAPTQMTHGADPPHMAQMASGRMKSGA